jgi:hypothetical protein
MTGSLSLMAQYTMPAELDSASIEFQLNYLQERTRIYNDFRAIRDDMFLKMRRNVLDSLSEVKLEVARLNSIITERNFLIETLNSDLERAKNERDQAIRTKDALSFLGMKMNKILYNTVMWIIVLGLAAFAIILFILFKRTHVLTIHTKKELEGLQEEYETYRKSSREKYEKLVVSHHSEIMKLKRS